jgi:hypothetical protein
LASHDQFLVAFLRSAGGFGWFWSDSPRLCVCDLGFERMSKSVLVSPPELSGIYYFIFLYYIFTFLGPPKGRGFGCEGLVLTPALSLLLSPVG